MSSFELFLSTSLEMKSVHAKADACLCSKLYPHVLKSVRVEATSMFVIFVHAFETVM